jgi:spore maturation protein CgeB
VSWRWQGTAPRVLRRLFSRVWIDDYNRAVLKQAKSSAYDFVLVFKGSLLKPETVRLLHESGRPVFNVYPDLSFEDHGPNIPAALQFYDCVFTTKSYHGEREIERFNIRCLEHVRHGFDPEVHRPLSLTAEMLKHYECDVSFVGCWSPKKEAQILHLLQRANGFSVKVFGLGWNYAADEFKRRLGANLRAGVFGDELAIVYRASKVNLGLLSCGVSNPTVSDQTTARSFQIPATRSLMLHEDTSEVRSFFTEKEVLLFGSNDEMVEQIERVMKDPDLRVSVREEGHRRCLREPYDYSSAALTIVNHFERSV